MKRTTRRISAIVRVGLWAGLLLCASGCGAIARYERDQQLKRVASDWNKTIRASQVIPVYPTTEDLQPGDMFLVTTPVDKQHHQWRGNEYLPLDVHLDRINPSGYGAFYKNSFFHSSGEETQDPTLPGSWLTPSKGDQIDPTKDTSNMLAWQRAPMAYFPGYSFSTSVGGGASAAFPISGVPIGLSLLGTGNATVTVQITDARTVGVDMLSLHRDLVPAWEVAQQPMLKHFATSAGSKDTRYVSVITRVYLARAMHVGITDASSFSGSASGGAPKPVTLLLTDEPSGEADVKSTTVSNYTKNIAELNKMISGLTPEDGAASSLLPGGTVKVVAASSGSISLKETFARPVVIGYLAFDMAITADGRLGPPVPTLVVVDQQVAPSTAALPIAKDPEILANALLQIRKSGTDQQVRALMTKPYDELTEDEKSQFGRLIGAGPVDPGDVNRDKAVYDALRMYLGEH